MAIKSPANTSYLCIHAHVNIRPFVNLASYGNRLVLIQGSDFSLKCETVNLQGVHLIEHAFVP